MERDILRLLLDHVRSRHFGKYRGTVIDNQDAQHKGRLQVSVPAVLPPGLSVWAMPCVPYAGDKVGLFAIPAPGAGVWVEFEAGDISCPIWVGCFWADGEAPDDANPDIKQFKTEKLTLRLDDAAPEIKLGPDDGATVTLTTDAVTEAAQAKLSVTPDGVTAEIPPRKTALTSTSFNVNNGALEVT
jgi:uncharacterized protein involved in type VI secretion and phage assembly